MTGAREITAALGGRWFQGKGAARCPTHKDRSPSLSISDGRNGVLLYCHAGCEFRDIAAELRRRGLLEDRVRGRETPRWSKAARREMQRVADTERRRKAELAPLIRNIRMDMLADGATPEEIGSFLAHSHEWKSRHSR